MKCIYCQGTMERNFSPFHISRKSCHLSLNEVPAWVCGQCGEACPMDIPVHLLSFQINEDIIKMFGSRAGLTLKKESLLSTWKSNDVENFIR